ncbi:hypothetical protein KC622_01990, partial [Candidatus Dojkabacteria bacterium]|nr:hypothetical protein [Candidatus Dojkabacteria bacterium]
MQKLLGRKKLGRKASHRRALVMNQLRSLFQHGELKTTSQKAKVLKANAESVISKARDSKNDLVTYRSMMNIFGGDGIAKAVIAYSKKSAASVQIRKVGFRDGDNAEVSRVSLMSFEKASKKKSKKSSSQKQDTKVKGKAAISKDDHDLEKAQAREEEEKISNKIGKSIKG